MVNKVEKGNFEIKDYHKTSIPIGHKDNWNYMICENSVLQVTETDTVGTLKNHKCIVVYDTKKEEFLAKEINGDFICNFQNLNLFYDTKVIGYI